MLRAGRVAKLRVDRGETVRFRARSDVPEEIHVHGYDLTKDVEPGKPVSMSFKADITGIFERAIRGAAAFTSPAEGRGRTTSRRRPATPLASRRAAPHRGAPAPPRRARAARRRSIRRPPRSPAVGAALDRAARIEPEQRVAGGPADAHVRRRLAQAPRLALVGRREDAGP